jgi:hypothetical protein
VCALKVFYSWQDNTPRKVGKKLIREALDEAISGLDVNDAERPVVDQDTQGVLGSPVIAETILKKIRAANVVVADVTLVGQTAKEKRLVNSNVAIELGYAMGVGGDEVMLKVMNEHYGPAKDLPFDLRHKRWPVQFTLSPDADPTERAKVRNALADELRVILRQYIEASRPPPERFVPTPATYNPAAYWLPDESLGKPEERPGRRTPKPLEYHPDQPLIYLRIWPYESIRPLGVDVLGDHGKSVIQPLCGRVQGWDWLRNKYGLLTYAVDADQTLTSSTQVFKSGEIWGINGFLLREWEDVPKYIPTAAYEEGLSASLTKYLETARAHFGYPARVMIESGLVNIADYKVALGDNKLSGPIFEDLWVLEMLDLDDPQSVRKALMKIFHAVHDAAGVRRS